jgi:uncharacterized membrane protein YeaQ/YmgE (transglycosylase-associated protein family)
MSLITIILLLVIAGVFGAVGQAIVGFRGGFLLSIGIGFIGALLGLWLSRELALPEFLTLTIGGTAFPVVWTIIGSALFTLVVAMIRRPRYRTA